MRFFCSMPEVTLPESVVSTNPKSISSFQYGSLRESKFSRQCDPLQGREQYGATNSFRTRSLPLNSENGVGAYFTAKSDLPSPSTHNSLDGVIQLLPQNCGANSQFRGDDVKGITEGCSDIALDDASVPSVQDSRGDACSFDLAPLSSSLTALDVLTRTKDSISGMVNTGSLEKTLVSGIISQHNESQQLHHCFPENPIGGNDDQHANPDTFEAFDFELDG